MMTVILAFASVVAVSLVSLVGLVTIAMDEARVRRLSTLFISLAVGALLGDAFIHLIPGIFETGAAGKAPLSASLLILGGMMLFFVAEKLLQHRHGVLYDY